MDVLEDLFKIALLPFSAIAFIYSGCGYPIPLMEDPTCLVPIQVYMLAICLMNFLHSYMFAELRWLEKIRSPFFLDNERVKFVRNIQVNKWYFGFLCISVYCIFDVKWRMDRQYNAIDGPVRDDNKCLNIGGCRAYQSNIPDIRSSTLLFSTSFVEDAAESGIYVKEKEIRLPQIMESRLAVHPRERWTYASNVVVISETDGDKEIFNDTCKNNSEVEISYNVYSNPAPPGNNDSCKTFSTSYSCAYMNQNRKKTEIKDIMVKECTRDTTWDNLDKVDKKIARDLMKNSNNDFKIQLNCNRNDFTDALRLAQRRGLLLDDDKNTSFTKIATSLVLNSYSPVNSENGVPVKIFTQVPAYLSKFGMGFVKWISCVSFIVLTLDLLSRLYINDESLRREQRSLLE